jgi:hypothetical protein
MAGGGGIDAAPAEWIRRDAAAAWGRVWDQWHGKEIGAAADKPESCNFATWAASAAHPAR